MAKRLKLIWWTVCTSLLAACGSGDSTPEFQISASPLAYSQQAVFTLSGSSISQVSRVSVNKCAGLAVQAANRPEDRAVSCTVSGSGEIRVELKDTNDTVIWSQSFVVPEPRVKLLTSLGNLTLQLDPSAAPLTARNFMGYVNTGFYDGTLIHRVVNDFVAQGGWLNTTPAEQPGRGGPILLESDNGLRNLRGAVGMARTAEPDSATSQFYFNLKDNPGLDYVSTMHPGYTVFARVVEGLDVMDRIGALTTGTRFGLTDFPLQDVVVQKVQQVQ